jgi:hypothetical protein
MTAAFSPVNSPVAQNRSATPALRDRPEVQKSVISSIFLMGTAGLEPATSRV